MENWPSMRVEYTFSYLLKCMILAVMLWFIIAVVPAYNRSNPLWLRVLALALMCILAFGILSMVRRALWAWYAYGDCEPRQVASPGFSEYLSALVALVSFAFALAYLVLTIQNFSQAFDKTKILLGPGIMLLSLFGFFPIIRWGLRWDQDGLHIGRWPFRRFYAWGEMEKVTFIRYDDAADRAMSFKVFLYGGTYSLFRSVRGPKTSAGFVESFHEECLRRGVPVDYKHEKYFDRNFTLDEVFEKRAV